MRSPRCARRRRFEGLIRNDASLGAPRRGASPLSSIARAAREGKRDNQQHTPRGGDSMASNKAAVRKVLAEAKAAGRSALTAPEGKLVCDAYGIAVPKEGVATSPREAAKLARQMGFPVVLKIVSPDI